MAPDEDPVQRASSDDADLYDVATWEPRTTLDRFAAWLYGGIVTTARASVVALAVLIVVAQFAAALGLVFVDRPVVGVYVLLSVVPALAMAGLVWKADVTRREPLELLVVTFSFGFLFAGFAAVLNSAVSGVFFGSLSEQSPLWLLLLAPALYYFLVVGPVEEVVKWLAVRLYAFRSERFDAVVDGAVYGAVAGLGFATIENAIYIAREVVLASQVAGPVSAAEIGLQTAAVRTLAGPGHVIYSAFAGYYLGLAKFNPEDAGPIVVKGLVVASVLHAVYNTVVTNLTIFTDPLGVSAGLAFIGFVVVYDGGLFYVLYRKLTRYRAAYEASGAARVHDAPAAGDNGDGEEGEKTEGGDDVEGGINVDGEDGPEFVDGEAPEGGGVVEDSATGVDAGDEQRRESDGQ
ncbi:PrsW family intramembrane metalloprotease [Halobacterium bonnevillei]|uniref:PrsW family intramembrane metalloprotease n=1 Tax=Halobacterium bonnevillei TaxID=2692200 RepID=A0A6B0SRT4_9EURY|nr:PrsW family intramembrane metalloprotease [Halobacterium bonnevillei]MXR22261.1 PrsW family intramembrane metalloprotease [Halobacterium bonnevillei]